MIQAQTDNEKELLRILREGTPEDRALLWELIQIEKHRLDQAGATGKD